MRDPKESFGGTNTGKGKGLTGFEEPARESAPQESESATTMKYCHGSVCLGNQKPTHCICPTDKK